MQLIITEKPSVAEEYAKVLGIKYSSKKAGYISGNGYTITWCVGHLITMSYPEKYDEKYKKWRIEDLPFLPEKYKYEVISSVKSQFNTVKKLLNDKNCTCIFYAGDSAREGLYIQWLLRMFAGRNKSATEKCVWIDSQTEEEIKRGLKTAKPMSSYALLADSAFMRAIEDYAIGINFSRVLSLRFGNMLNDFLANDKWTPISVGRVMTCVLGLIVNREMDIRNFKETSFYRIEANLSANGQIAIFEWKAVEGTKYYNSPLLYKENGFKEKSDAQSLINELTSESIATIQSVTKITEKKSAPLLYNLAELQNDCSKILKISPANTMKIIQELYESKLTTYPRTDARVLTTAVAKEIEKNITGLGAYPFAFNFVKTILENKWHIGIENTKYTNDKKVSDHYAIIPTGCNNDHILSLSDNQKKVFNLIVIRFLSIFYPPAEYLKASVVANIKNELFYNSLKILKSQGFLAVANVFKEDDGNDTVTNQTLANAVFSLKEGQKIAIDNIHTAEGKTAPPKRYSSGSIILAMENAGQLIEDPELREQIKSSGIGTSATRTEILSKLNKNNYIKINPKTQIITPDKAGEMVYTIVFYLIRPLLSPELTANWEKGLDMIEKGKVTKTEYQEKLYGFVRRQIEGALKTDRDELIKKRLEEIDSMYTKQKRKSKKL